MKPRSAKNKGKRLQNDIVSDLLMVFPELTDMDVISTPNSVNGIDVWMSNKAKELIPFSIEAKCQEKLSIWAALQQAENNAEDLTPLLVFRRNHTKAYACLPFSDFIEMVSLLAKFKKAFEHEHETK